MRIVFNVNVLLNQIQIQKDEQCLFNHIANLILIVSKAEECVKPSFYDQFIFVPELVL